MAKSKVRKNQKVQKKNQNSVPEKKMLHKDSVSVLASDLTEALQSGSLSKAPRDGVYFATGVGSVRSALFLRGPFTLDDVPNPQVLFRLIMTVSTLAVPGLSRSRPQVSESALSWFLTEHRELRASAEWFVENVVGYYATELPADVVERDSEDFYSRIF